QRAETEKDSIRGAYDSALSLMGLIGDILDLAKIESGKLELTPEWVRIDDLALPVVHVFDGLARQKGITLECHIDALHPDEVYLDPMRLRQILSNLVSNAIKFTDQGLVNVQI
ncbi:sensor histidine kinase, partial [Pseudomonas aeruginosa]